MSSFRTQNAHEIQPEVQRLMSLMRLVYLKRLERLRNLTNLDSVSPVTHVTHVTQKRMSQSIDIRRRRSYHETHMVGTILLGDISLAASQATPPGYLLLDITNTSNSRTSPP